MNPRKQLPRKWAWIPAQNAEDCTLETNPNEFNQREEASEQMKRIIDQSEGMRLHSACAAKPRFDRAQAWTCIHNG
jgi:glutathionylspermidine synthase